MKKPAEKWIAYYRVSTAQQGISGLGLDAQRSAIKERAISVGAVIVGEYTDIESGKKGVKHPAFEEALRFAAKEGAVLVVKTLDRVSRDMATLHQLRGGKQRLLALDMPSDDDFTFSMYAAFAQAERKKISERTKAALAVKKIELAKEGKQLGTPRRGFRPHENFWLLPAKAKREKTMDLIKPVIKMILDKRANGETFQSIAEHLNRYGFKTAKGLTFNRCNVRAYYETYSKVQGEEAECLKLCEVQGRGEGAQHENRG